MRRYSFSSYEGKGKKKDRTLRKAVFQHPKGEGGKVTSPPRRKKGEGKGVLLWKEGKNRRIRREKKKNPTKKLILRPDEARTASKDRRRGLDEEESVKLVREKRESSTIYRGKGKRDLSRGRWN